MSVRSQITRRRVEVTVVVVVVVIVVLYDEERKEKVQECLNNSMLQLVRT
jgi:hypothetical protein